VEFLPALNPARASSPTHNDENKSQLEKATFLSLTTGILHHDFSWLSDAPGTSAEDKAKTGASRPTQEQDELQAL
jgi:hypothetical protein